MSFFRRIAPFLVPLALASSPLQAEDSVNLNFFPQQGFSRSVLPSIQQTGISFPIGLQNEILQKPIRELAPYISIAKEVPIVSLEARTDRIPENISPEVIESTQLKADLEGRTLSNKLFSASLIGNASLKFPKDENPQYTAGLELFLEFPLRDSYLSDGNRLIIAPGFKAKGSLMLADIAEKSLADIAEILPVNSTGFSTNVYVVMRNQYSNQFLILMAGASNLFNSSGENPIANISAALEFPSLFRNLKALPYGAIDIKLLLGYRSHELDGEIGLRFPGKEGKSLVSYIGARLREWEGIKFSSGLRLEL